MRESRSSESSCAISKNSILAQNSSFYAKFYLSSVFLRDSSDERMVSMLRSFVMKRNALLCEQKNRIKVSLLNTMKQKVFQFCEDIEKTAIKRVAIYGTGENAIEIFQHLPPAAQIVAVVDGKTKSQGNSFFGITIQSPQILNEIHVDDIIVTSFANAQYIVKRIQEIYNNRDIPRIHYMS